MTIKKTVLSAAVLGVATILAVGLTVLPNSVQEAQAETCDLINEGNQVGVICYSANLGSLYPDMVASEGVSVPPFDDDSDEESVLP
jgi:hypothetical protein